MPIDRITPPPASRVYGSPGPGNVPPEAIEAAKEIADRLVELSRLYADLDAATTGKERLAILKEIQNKFSAVGPKIDDLIKMRADLPKNAQATLDRLAEKLKHIAESGEGSPSIIHDCAMEAARLYRELGQA
jgi:hypothetical protein